MGFRLFAPGGRRRRVLARLFNSGAAGRWPLAAVGDDVSCIRAVHNCRRLTSLYITPTKLYMPAPPLSIIQSLSPRVAVLASDDVADSCAANGCRGLNELLRPWEGGTERGESVNAATPRTAANMMASIH